MTFEQRQKALAATHAKTRRFFLPSIAAQGAAASRDWYFSQPEEQRAFVVSRMVAAWMRAAAIRRGQPPPILFEREARPDENGTLIVDTSKVQDAFNPDPRLYRALPGGGFTFREVEAQWNRNLSLEHAAEARRYRRNARRRARRAARNAAKAADTRSPNQSTLPRQRSRTRVPGG
jgi:hypothetical protein